MTDNRSFERSTAKRRTLLSALLLPALAFLLGLAAMGWLLTRWEAAASFIGINPPAQAQPSPAPGRSATPAQALPAAGEPQTLLIDPEMQRRVNQLEQRIAEIDDQSRAAVGNADRAEGLLVAFAARRALDRGVALGYIEGLLEVGPDLTGGAPDQNWWSAFKSEFDDLITIRRAGTPSTMPAERLRRATRRLESGQVDVALAEVLRMPGRDKAAEWVASARRYVAARRALDTIETAALLEPRAATLAALTPVAARPSP